MTIAVGTVEGRWVWNGTRWSCSQPPASPPAPPCPPGTGPFVPPAAASVPQFANVATVRAANIPCGSTIQTLGYYAAGDGGGATYILAPVQSNAMDGNIQSADGQWWQYVPETRGVNCKSFGAKADGSDLGAAPWVSGTDNTPMIQAALNYAMRNKVRKVFLPGGMYMTAGTLHIGWGDTVYSLDFEGDDRAYTTGMAGTMILFAPVIPGGSTAVPQCINIQGARHNSITGIHFYFSQNYYYVLNNLANNRPTDPLYPWTIPSTPAGWVDPSITNALAVNAPLAAITVDAFAGAAPAIPYPPVTFPVWTGLSAQYNKQMFSSNIKVTRCYFKGFPVGFSNGINGANQGDYCWFDDNWITHGAYGITINNPQSRAVAVRNMGYTFLHTVLDNASFGQKNGLWSGPIVNLTGGECYQIFNFGQTLAGGMTIANVYCEGALRRLGVWNSTEGLDLINCVLNFSDSQYESSRALIEGGTAAVVRFTNCEFANHYGINNLCYGATARTIVSDGNYFASGVRFSSNTVAGYQARAYGGGIIINGGAANPASQNKVRGASFISAPTTTSFVTSLWSDDEAQAGWSTNTFLYREGMTAFRDLLFQRRWQIRSATPIVSGSNVNIGTIRKGTSGTAATNITQTGEVVTFTYAQANQEGIYGYNNYGFAVGDILIDQPSGALLVVTAKVLASGTPPTSGVYTITAIQTNCYTNYPNTPGGWTSTASPLVTNAAGNFQIVRATTAVPQNVYMGDFTAGSPNVANIHGGDNNGSAIANTLVAGMLLHHPGTLSRLATGMVTGPVPAEYPVRENTFIGTVTNGTASTGGTMTLTLPDGVTAQNAVFTGRYPISTIGLEDPSGPSGSAGLISVVPQNVTAASAVVTGNSVTVAATATCTLTLPTSPSVNLGSWLHIVSTTAQIVQSASANIIPLAGGAATNAIFPATAPHWCTLQWNGTNWVTFAAA